MTFVIDNNKKRSCSWDSQMWTESCSYVRRRANRIHLLTRFVICRLTTMHCSGGLRYFGP